MSALSRLLGLGDVADDEPEIEEFLEEWADGDAGEGALSLRAVLLIGAAAAALLIMGALITRRRRALATRSSGAPVAPHARQAPRQNLPGELELGPGQRARLGMIFDPADDELGELTE